MQQRWTRGLRGASVALTALMALPNSAAAQGPTAAQADGEVLLAARLKQDPGTTAAKAKDPFGTAKALAALMRFAGGQLGTSAYDRRVAAALGKVSGAREIARRILLPFEAMGAN